jgi:hypothetical protein
VAALVALWSASHRGVVAALAVLTGLGAAAAGAASLSMDRVAAPWMRIAWRAIASWIGAILVLFFAFALRSGVS